MDNKHIPMTVAVYCFLGPMLFCAINAFLYGLRDEAPVWLVVLAIVTAIVLIPIAFIDASLARWSWFVRLLATTGIVAGGCYYLYAIHWGRYEGTARGAPRIVAMAGSTTAICSLVVSYLRARRTQS